MRDPHPEEPRERRLEDAGPPVASWFEARFALLTMRVLKLIYAEAPQKKGPPKRASLTHTQL